MEVANNCELAPPLHDTSTGLSESVPEIPHPIAIDIESFFIAPAASTIAATVLC